jgi:hypothetical protein
MLACPRSAYGLQINGQARWDSFVAVGNFVRLEGDIQPQLFISMMYLLGFVLAN